MVLSHLARRSGRKEHEPIVEEKANDQARKEFEAFFNEMAANLRQSPAGKKQDSENQAEEHPEKKSDDKPPQFSEGQ